MLYLRFAWDHRSYNIVEHLSLAHIVRQAADPLQITLRIERLVHMIRERWRSPPALREGGTAYCVAVRAQDFTLWKKLEPSTALEL